MYPLKKTPTPVSLVLLYSLVALTWLQTEWIVACDFPAVFQSETLHPVKSSVVSEIHGLFTRVFNKQLQLINFCPLHTQLDLAILYLQL